MSTENKRGIAELIFWFGTITLFRLILLLVAVLNATHATDHKTIIVLLISIVVGDLLSAIVLTLLNRVLQTILRRIQ